MLASAATPAFTQVVGGDGGTDQEPGAGGGKNRGQATSQAAHEAKQDAKASGSKVGPAVSDAVRGEKGGSRGGKATRAAHEPAICARADLLLAMVEGPPLDAIAWSALDPALAQDGCKREQPA
jgi:hypothetical protein